MIRANDVNPDFNKIQKYLSTQPLSRLDGLFFHYFDKVKPEFNNTEFEKLLTKYNLTEHLSNIYVFAWYYSETWNSYLRNIEEFNDTSWPAQTYSDLKKLNEFLLKNKYDRLTLSSSKSQTTIKSEYILNDIDIFIRAYTKELWEEWKDKEYLVKKELEFKTRFPKKQSFKKKFTETLKYLYRYLKHETHLKNEKYQDTDIYDFIDSLCLLIECDELPTELRKYIK